MGLVIKLTSTFTDTSLPKLYKDSVLNLGSLFLFDFKNPATYQGGALPAPGFLANGASLYNLVDAAPLATVNGTQIAYNSAGAIEFNSVGNVVLGDNYNLASSNPNFMISMWIKMTAASNSYAQLLGRSTTTTPNNTQWRIDMGLDGLRPRGGAGGSVQATVAEIPNGSLVAGTLYHIAFSRVGASISTYLNGVQIRTATMPEATLANPAVIPNMGGGCKALVYRAYMENLTVSGKNPLAQVQADYNANLGRFN
ncbi:LamG-like jellyroll fold domain-containing protein [Fibrella aquatica]|uniref:LamG-like jellyroll fold domain-containing protein n=1 Tax=Fibrella aquatica TaxID=3242487 RepID=UPI0035216D98